MSHSKFLCSLNQRRALLPMYSSVSPCAGRFTRIVSCENLRLGTFVHWTVSSRVYNSSFSHERSCRPKRRRKRIWMDFIIGGVNNGVLEIVFGGSRERYSELEEGRLCWGGLWDYWC